MSRTSSRALTESELLARYPHAQEGTLEGEGHERSMVILCQHEGCSVTRKVRTASLHETIYCEYHAYKQAMKVGRERRMRYKRRQKNVS